ncbi:MAG: hypothetical protein FJX80_05405, partial [Bacteroidetes bacterium]|nr:hypothetical protein [Bacteroidota bacterium]
MIQIDKNTFIQPVGSKQRFGLIEAHGMLATQNHIEYYHHKVHHTTEQTPNRRYEESMKKLPESDKNNK